MGDRYAILAKWNLAGAEYGSAGEIPYRPGEPPEQQVRDWVVDRWTGSRLASLAEAVSDIRIIGLLDLDPPAREGDPLAPLPEMDGLPVFADPDAIKRRTT